MVQRRKPLRTEPWLLPFPRTDTSLKVYTKGRSNPTELCQRARERISEAYGNSLHVYTDGSKSADGVGCAYVSAARSRRFRLYSHASIFTAELLAIQKSISFIAQTDVVQAAIFSDSLSAILAIKSMQLSRTYLVQKIVESIHQMSIEGREVTLVWVPSHVGLSGNERADAAAKGASLMPPSNQFKIPAVDLKFAIKRSVDTEWQQRWNELPSNKLRTMKPTIKPWPSSNQRNRREEVTLCRLRIGHTYQTHRFLLLRDTDRPECERCGEHLSVKHILVDCEEYAPERRRCFNSLISISAILGNPDECDINSIMRFLHLTRFKVIYNPAPV